MFFINFKNYAQAFEGFPRIYQELEKVVQKYPKVLTALAPPPLLLAKVAEIVRIPLWAQHLDPQPLGAHTGFLPAAASAKVGAVGTFLNHSEHPLDPQKLEQSVRLAKGVGLLVLIFADTPEKIYKIKDLIPDYFQVKRESESESAKGGRELYIAYEPPELIGGEISVTSARAEIIPEAVRAAKPTPLLVGAGVHKGEDIETALRLGAVGAVVSSAIVTAPQPPMILEELLSAF